MYIYIRVEPGGKIISYFKIMKLAFRAQEIENPATLYEFFLVRAISLIKKFASLKEKLFVSRITLICICIKCVYKLYMEK